MENNQILDEPTPTDLKPKIYSRQAIWGFSFFFTPLVGGILLSQNLKDIGNRRKANSVLVTAISITLGIFIIDSIPNKTIPFLTLIFNIAGASFFSEYYFKRYFPSDADYEKKKIWKPLLICIGVSAVIILAAIGSDLITGALE